MKWVTEEEEKGVESNTGGHIQFVILDMSCKFNLLYMVYVKLNRHMYRSCHYALFSCLLLEMSLYLVIPFLLVEYVYSTSRLHIRI